MTAAAPEAYLGVLPKADGSATYKYAGYTVTASVNGPIEAARRDEHPYKAHVDVIVRPAAGTGGKLFRQSCHPFDSDGLSLSSEQLYRHT
jgi:exosome complex component RRP46